MKKIAIAMVAVIAFAGAAFAAGNFRSGVWVGAAREAAGGYRFVGQIIDSRQ